MLSNKLLLNKKIIVRILLFAFILLSFVVLNSMVNKSFNLNQNSRLNALTVSSLSITTTSLPNVTVCGLSSSNCPSYYTTLNASGGTSPYSWSLIKGTLPYGISLSSNGALSGNAYFFDQPGVYNFQVQVKDSNGNLASTNLSLDLL